MIVAWMVNVRARLDRCISLPAEDIPTDAPLELCHGKSTSRLGLNSTRLEAMPPEAMIPP
jgi:hypothetical protein